MCVHARLTLIIINEWVDVSKWLHKGALLLNNWQQYFMTVAAAAAASDP